MVTVHLCAHESIHQKNKRGWIWDKIDTAKKRVRILSEVCLSDKAASRSSIVRLVKTQISHIETEIYEHVRSVMYYYALLQTCYYSFRVSTHVAIGM